MKRVWPSGRSLRGNVDRNLLVRIAVDGGKAVVPYVGTWIEIRNARPLMMKRLRRSLRGNVDRNDLFHAIRMHAAIVVPYVGTWIEMIRRFPSHLTGTVVPYVGTWIEIFRPLRAPPAHRSFPTWERG